MHQPDYRNESGIMQMPWVFLHAIKDYYDMPWMMSRHDGIKATYNITSPLIEQLKLYYHLPQYNDKFLSSWLRDPSQLDEVEREFLIKICKSTQYDTMLEGFNRYKELFAQEHYNNTELIDLEVLFLLSWCGVYLKTTNLLVQELMKKQRDYSHNDKENLLNELSKFVATIFNYYSELNNKGSISLSTTPLNHPILPLLIDMQNGVRANINTKIPKDHVSLKEDAVIHVQRAQELFKDTFGFMPRGFWPAEGGVDENTVALLKSCGIEWIATDEEILFKSLNSNARENLYVPYNCNGMVMGFRDHALSDLIGFTYRHKEPHDAAANFLAELQKIEHSNPDATVFVILDGENAWEFYKNNGFDFFDSLYASLKQAQWCHTVTMDEVLEFNQKKLAYIAPGSWIHGSFDTWVGHSEKTRAWELIYLTKRDYEHHKNDLNDEAKAKILNHFLAAESSDWFWWYGDDHYTEFGVEFDELFRSHLITIYDAMKITAPADLFIPIIQDRSVQDFWLQPQSDISPNINGLHDSFFEWIGCGVVDESKLFSTMDRARGPITRILYGQDDNKLYFAFEADIDALCKANNINIIIDPVGITGKVSFKNTKTFVGPLEVGVACGNWLELSIDKTTIQNDEIFIRFELEQDESVIQTLPGFGELKIDLGNDYSRNWFI
jgi:alpha-amylase/alpha-mannosidase (GH57 family)